MAEQNLIERLDEAIGAILAGRREDLALADPSLAMLLVIAEDLRDLPDPTFKARLKAKLIRAPKEEAMSTITVKEIMPPGFHTVTPYLVVNGAADLITFLQQAFDAEERLRVPRPDGTIQHAELRIGDSMIEIGDATEQWKPLQFPLHLHVPDADAVYQRAIRAGATSLEHPTDQPYGNREAGVQDRWGNQWWISTHQEDVSDEEVMRRFGGGTWSPKKDPSVPPIPKGFRTITAGIRAHGAARLIDFLEETFDAQEIGHRMPMPDGTIMYTVVQIGDSVVEMGDPHGPWGAMPVGIHLFVEDPDAAYERALKAGATSLIAPADTPYGQRVGGVADPAGNFWFMARVL